MPRLRRWPQYHDKVAPEARQHQPSRVFNCPWLDFTVEYSVAPEHLNKPDALNHTELRTVELNPNFTARCYLTNQ